MPTVTSADGTTIAYAVTGDGPPLVLVDGALCYRRSGPNGALATELADRFSVVTYDRRGRGDSTDRAPYEVAREVEDLAALIDAVGGAASLYGISSGGALALDAAAHGLPVTRLAVYEVPMVADDSRPPLPDGYEERMTRLVDEGRRADAVRMFMRDGVGLPAIAVAMMRLMPAWSTLKQLAHTLPYDTALTADLQHGCPPPSDRWGDVDPPTAVICGGKSPDWMQHGMHALADTLPNATHHTLEGQTHIVKAKALAPLVTEVLTA
jgi:pimeloyl-ACP methyl ester carboxylesterase